jgi:hypothetical protein
MIAVLNERQKVEHKVIESYVHLKNISGFKIRTAVSVTACNIFSVFFAAPPGKFQDGTWIMYYCMLPIPFEFLIYN